MVERRITRTYSISLDEIKEVLHIAFKEWDIPVPKDYKQFEIIECCEAGITINWREEIK